jgi:hypothetical protein
MTGFAKSSSKVSAGIYEVSAGISEISAGITGVSADKKNYA